MARCAHRSSHGENLDSRGRKGHTEATEATGAAEVVTALAEDAEDGGAHEGAKAALTTVQGQVTIGIAMLSANNEMQIRTRKTPRPKSM